MAHGLRGLGLLAVVGAVGCTAPEKIAPTRLQLPPPQLPPAGPTAASKPADPTPDNRGQVRPAAAAVPVSDAPMVGQVPSIGGPPPAPNPATLQLSPNGVKVPGRDVPAVPQPVPGSNTPYTPPGGLNSPIPPDAIPTPQPPPPPGLGRPIEVVPPLPTPALPK